MKYDVIVAGAGHNGLAAAAYLAKSQKRVLLLEGADEIGGATASVRPFPEFDARLSRYSYLVALLPDQIVKDLGLNFKTLERGISSYTPYRENGNDRGLLVTNRWSEETSRSFHALTGSDSDGYSWQNFYAEIATFAERIAPTFLEPLRTRKSLRDEINLPDIWQYLIERPIGNVIQERFQSDLLRGIILTDALIGTFVHSDDLQANTCFLYHLVGNGTGQWRVPQGGMGEIVKELSRVARSCGVEIRTHSRVVDIDSSSSGVLITIESGERFQARDLIFAGAPQTLDILRGRVPEKSREGSQLKINMLLERLPRLKSGEDPQKAFAGTFHVNESFTQLNSAFHSAINGKFPDPLPLEMYCHTLTDPTILSGNLQKQGYHTLTLFGLHTSASLFDHDNDSAREVAKNLAFESLNQYLLDPIESVLAKDSAGEFTVEVKSPLDLEEEIGLPRGNIFHRDLNMPFIEEGDNRRWGSETDDPHIFLGGAGALRGGGVSAIAGHNAAQAILEKR